MIDSLLRKAARPGTGRTCCLIPCARTPLLVCAVLLLSATALRAEGPETAEQAVRTAVSAELSAGRQDHMAWDYRDHDVQPGKDALSQVIETPRGNLKRLLELNGHPLTGAAEQEELDRIRAFVSSPSEQAKRRKAGAQDDAQARELLGMLPNAFVWTVTGENAQEIFLRFQPRPDFKPPDMQSRVLGVMAGEMIIARNGNRIALLKGTLTSEVRFGFGIFGKIDQGGTFSVERREIAPGHWQITETHVHIGGHALLFKTIGQQEDETKSGWRPSTAPDLFAAEQQITHLP